MKTDARKLSSEAQQQIHYQAIQLRKKGLSRFKITDLLGVNQSGGLSLVSAWENSGKTAIELGQKCRKARVKVRSSDT